MPRIRTIKPEFPQSESMGRVSREARLLFLLLFTQADDEGRGRGNSPLLASLLYPYDDDAVGEIDGWFAELEAEQCVYRYRANGNLYFIIPKWREHQRIDHASQSKMPPFVESSRIFANLREASWADQGMDQGRDQGEDQGTLCQQSRHGENGKGGSDSTAKAAEGETAEATPPKTAKARKTQPQGYPDDFEKFWQVYPNRHGRKRGKDKSLVAWKRLAAIERQRATVAACNYANSSDAKRDFAKDPERFLSGGWWKDWEEAVDERSEDWT